MQSDHLAQDFWNLEFHFSMLCDTGICANTQIIFSCVKPFSLSRPQGTFYSKVSVSGKQCLYEKLVWFSSFFPSSIPDSDTTEGATTNEYSESWVSLLS